jgi:hypothetical protein
MKYEIDCFTDLTVGTKFPENHYEADTPEEMARIVANCARPTSGIVMVEVWFNHGTEENH